MTYPKNMNGESSVVRSYIFKSVGAIRCMVHDVGAEYKAGKLPRAQTRLVRDGLASRNYFITDNTDKLNTRDMKLYRNSDVMIVNKVEAYYRERDCFWLKVA